MRDLVWDRPAAAATVADRLWLMVSGQAGHLADFLPHASAVLQLPRSDVVFLRSLHLALSPESAELIAAAPDLLRTLRTSTSSILETHPDRLRGPVAWGDTVSMWSRTGMRGGYATRPVHRDYDTPENRLLRGSLGALSDALAQVGDLASGGEVGEMVTVRTAQVAHSRATPVMRYVKTPPSPADLRRVQRGRSGRRMAPVTRFWGLADRLTRLEDRALLRAMVERAALVSTDTGVLMESLVLFRAWDVLEENGWAATPPRLVRGQLAVRFTRGGEVLVICYQQVPPTMAGKYSGLLRRHGLPPSSLRPDLVLERSSRRHDISSVRGLDAVTRRLVVEVKYRQRAEDAARAALHDLLAYRENYSVAGRAEGTDWLGVVWGEGLDPIIDSEVWLCTYDRMRAGIMPLVA